MCVRISKLCQILFSVDGRATQSQIGEEDFADLLIRPPQMNVMLAFVNCANIDHLSNPLFHHSSISSPKAQGASDFIHWLALVDAFPSLPSAARWRL